MRNYVGKWHRYCLIGSTRRLYIGREDSVRKSDELLMPRTTYLPLVIGF